MLVDAPGLEKEMAGGVSSTMPSKPAFREKAPPDDAAFPACWPTVWYRIMVPPDAGAVPALETVSDMISNPPPVLFVPAKHSVGENISISTSGILNFMQLILNQSFPPFFFCKSIYESFLFPRNLSSCYHLSRQQ